MVSVIVVAGGDGKRFGATIPKQFVKVYDIVVDDIIINTVYKKIN